MGGGGGSKIGLEIDRVTTNGLGDNLLFSFWVKQLSVHLRRMFLKDGLLRHKLPELLTYPCPQQIFPAIQEQMEPRSSGVDSRPEYTGPSRSTVSCAVLSVSPRSEQYAGSLSFFPHEPRHCLPGHGT